MFSSRFRPEGEGRQPTSAFLEKFDFVKIMLESYRASRDMAKKNNLLERNKNYRLRLSLETVSREIMLANRYSSQGLLRNLVRSLARLHRVSIELMLLSRSSFEYLAESNSLSVLKYIEKDYHSPWLPVYSIERVDVVFLSSFLEIPEYILSGPRLSNYQDAVEFDFFKRLHVSTRVAMEIFLTSSLALQWYVQKKKINTAFLIRMLENGKEIELLMDLSVSGNDIVEYEIQREKRVLETIADENNRIMVSSNQPWGIEDKIELESYLKSAPRMTLSNLALELESDEEMPTDGSNVSERQTLEDERRFLQFVEELQGRDTAYSLINIYLSLAVCHAQKENVEMYDKNKDIWSLLKKSYPRHSPFLSKSPSGENVEIFLHIDMLEHKGLSNNPQVMNEQSFYKNRSPSIRRIVPEILNFFAKE